MFVPVGFLVGLKLYFWVVLPIIITIFLFIWETFRKSYDEHALNIGLGSLYKSLYFSPSTNPDVRCTLYTPKFFKRNYLNQLLPYTPRGGGKGRKLHNSKGIVGKCYRSQKTCFEYISDENAARFREYMVDNWSFTEEEAARLVQDRRAYMCLPITNRKGNSVLGVIYFDSNSKDLFTPEVADKAEKLMPIFGELLTMRVVGKEV